MFDLDKIFQIVDGGKEVFLARDGKPMLVISTLEKYDKLAISEKKDVLDNQFSNTKITDDYASRVRSSIIE